MKNPQAFKQYEEIRKNNGNPEEILKQTMQGYTPEQMKQFTKFANSMGIPTEQLQQYGINTK